MYYIRNVNSGHYLDVPNGNSGDGTDLIQYGFNGNANQQFKAVYNSSTDDYVLIPMCATGSAVETSWLNENGQDVQIWSKPSSGYMNSQRFRIARNSDGSYRILSYVSNYTRAAVVSGARHDNGAPIIHCNDNGSTNGFWVFEAVNFGNGGTYRQVNSFPPQCFGYTLFLEIGRASCRERV